MLVKTDTVHITKRYPCYKIILILVMTNTVHIWKDMLVLIYITVMLVRIDTVHTIQRYPCYKLY